MNTHTFGFDLGINSIGWSVVDKKQNKIIASGVRIIPNANENGTPERRKKRQARRQLHRKKMRKTALIKALQAKNMFPNISQGRHAIKLEEPLKTFFKQNPYQLRAEALKRPLTPMELGRVLFQLAQRRGFPTKRLDAGSTTKKDKKTMQNESEAQKFNMHSFGFSENQMSQYKTLGEMLYKEDKKYPNHLERINMRRRYTKREWFEDECRIIWKEQQTYHPNLLTDEYKEKIEHILFFQRPLKSQSKNIGKCTFEKGEKRVPKYNLFFEQYRFYKTLNNMKIDGNPLDETQRAKLIAKMCNKGDIKIEKIAETLKIDENSLNYQEDKTLSTCKIAYRLQQLFNKKEWKERYKACQLSYYNNLLGNLRKCQNTEDLEAFIQKWQLKELPQKTKKPKKLREELLDLHKELKPQYASLSEKVIRAALPFLKGDPANNLDPQPEYIAIPLASLQKVFAHDGKSWEKQNKTKIITDIIDIIQNNQTKRGNYSQQLKEYLKEKHKLSEEAIAQCYHHSHQKINEIASSLSLEHMPELCNPTVTKILSELRRLCNNMLDSYHAPETIRIEFARELKKSEKEREKIANQQKTNKNERIKIMQKLAEKKVKPTARNILKYQLWQETNKECVYQADQQNNKIPSDKLFTEAWDVDHIVPKSLFHTNARFNLTLCPADMNRHEKGKQTPYQWLKDNPQKWEKIKACAKKRFKKGKYEHFISEKDPLPMFMDKDAQDTAYIAREARTLLRHICPKVYPVKGGVTALLRKQWELNNLIAPTTPNIATDLADGMYFVAIDNDKIVASQKDPYDTIKTGETADQADEKAFVSNYKTAVNYIKKKLKKAGRVLYGAVYDGKFRPEKTRDDYRHNQIDAVVVAFANNYNQYFNKLSGRGKKYQVLETLEIEPPYKQFRSDLATQLAQSFVSFRQINRHYQKRGWYLADGRKVYFDTVRGQLHTENFYGQHDSMYYQKNKVKKIKTSKQLDKIEDPYLKKTITDWFNQKPNKISPYPYFGSEDNSLPIKKVSLAQTISNARKVSETSPLNQWVDPENNYMVAIYHNAEGKWSDEVISLWDAVQRKKKGESIVPAVNEEGDPLYFTLRQYDYFVLGLTSNQMQEIHWDDPTQNDLTIIHNHLYRVRTLSKKNYYFDPHNHINEILSLHIQSMDYTNKKGFQAYRPVKVTINRLGKITSHKILYPYQP